MNYINLNLFYQLQEYRFKMDQTLIKDCQQTLKKNNYEPIRKLGMGGFGIVFLVSKIGSNSQLYSVKCTNKKQFVKKPAMRRYLKQQISLMESLNHDNIVKLYKAFEDDGWIFMVLEYCDIGNLSMVQLQKKNGLFTFIQCARILREIISGLEYMHERGILHRDIKPQNILLTKTKKGIKTKICDLGFSREADENQASTFCGTTYYIAPEIFQKKKYGKPIDVWAVGILMHNMLFGVLPFKSLNMALQITQKCQGGFQINKKKIRQNPSIDQELLEKLSLFLGKIFAISPSKRINLVELDKFLSQEISNSEFHKKDAQDTHESDNGSDQGKLSKSISFEMQQVNFVHAVLDQVSGLQFLQPIEFMTLKYYLDRVCLSIISCQRTIQNQQEKETISRLWDSQKFEMHMLGQNIKSCRIPKLVELFTGKQTLIFRQYKEQYRLAVGHAFYKAHKNIKDYDLKMRVKLKIFCCHVINRVFQKQYNKQLFVHYHTWVKDKKKMKSSKFQMAYFREWIEEDQVKNIVETVDIINNKFYRKG